MPVETRYMVNARWTINGYEAYKLKKALDEGTGTKVSTIFLSGDLTVNWFIHLYRRDVNGNTIPICDVEWQAQVTRTAAGEGIQSATWTCPEVLLEPTDAIMVEVIIDLTGWQKSTMFITEQLGANKLNSTTWTVYYWTSKIYDSKLNYTAGEYGFGDTTFYSRIENFSYEAAAPPPPAVRRIMGDGLTCVVAGSV